MESQRWRVAAYAKVNMGLTIVGRRPDGYHDLRTVFQSIDLHDTIRVQLRAGDFRVRSTGEELPLGPANLVWRAAAAVWRELGRSGSVRDAEVSMEKRVPVRAGLGGGSADAAATLVLLATAWGGGMSIERLDRLASGIGADVPFFLRGGRAIGSGRGDVIEPVEDQPPRWIVLALPAFGVSTVDAYRWFDEAAGHGASADAGTSCARPDPIANDLEPPVAARHPPILELKRLLQVAGAEGAAMSGSGSAVYGLFEDSNAARAAVARLRREGWSARLSRTLTRKEYEDLAAPVTERRSTA